MYKSPAPFAAQTAHILSEAIEFQTFGPIRPVGVVVLIILGSVSANKLLRCLW